MRESPKEEHGRQPRARTLERSAPRHAKAQQELVLVDLVRRLVLSAPAWQFA
jgi:hypothetical protein